MYHVELHNTVEMPWTAMDPIRVGPVPRGIGTPDIYLTVERDGQPFARIDAWLLGGGPFTQFIAWKHWVILGWNSFVHLIDPRTREVRSIECDLYFGHVYLVDDRLLIATASELICLNEQGNVVWARGNLAIDGVVVDQVQPSGIIEGQGEWDPPGGWKPFRLSISDGRPIAQ